MDLLPTFAGGTEMLGGALVWVGFSTRIVASVICLFQLAMLSVAHEGIELHLLRSAVGVGLVFLGPGAWSLDARLFGRRRVEIPNLGDN